MKLIVTLILICRPLLLVSMNSIPYISYGGHLLCSCGDTDTHNLFLLNNNKLIHTEENIPDNYSHCYLAFWKLCIGRMKMLN